MNRIAARGWLGREDVSSDRGLPRSVRPRSNRTVRASLSSWAKRRGFEGPMDRVTRWN